MKLLQILEGNYKSWGSKERIHVSSEKIDNLIDYTNQQKEMSLKPIGMWYAFGEEWLKWVYNEGMFSSWGKDYDRYRYKIFVDKSKILTLLTEQDVIQFVQKYSYENAPYNLFINWSEVTKNYSGFEIPNYFNSDIYKLCRNNIWLSIVDVPSGCIWNPNAITKIKLIGEVKPEQASNRRTSSWHDDY